MALTLTTLHSAEIAEARSPCGRKTPQESILLRLPRPLHNRRPPAPGAPLSLAVRPREQRPERSSVRWRETPAKERQLVPQPVGWREGIERESKKNSSRLSSRTRRRAAAVRHGHLPTGLYRLHRG